MEAASSIPAGIPAAEPERAARTRGAQRPPAAAERRCAPGSARSRAGIPRGFWRSGNSSGPLQQRRVRHTLTSDRAERPLQTGHSGTAGHVLQNQQMYTPASPRRCRAGPAQPPAVLPPLPAPSGPNPPFAGSTQAVPARQPLVLGLSHGPGQDRSGPSCPQRAGGSAGQGCASSRAPARPQRGRAGTQPLRVFTVPTHPQRVLTASLTASHTPTAGPGRHTATACLHRPHTPRAGTQTLRVFTVPTHPQRVLTASHTPTAGPGRHTATACLHRPHTPTACPHGLPHAHSGAGPAHSHCVSSPSPHTHSVSSRPPTRPQRGRAGTQPLRVFTVPTHPQRVLTASHTPTAGPGRHTATACLHRPHTPTACPHGLPHAHSGAGPAHSHCVSSPSPHTHSVSSRPPTRPQRGRAGTQPLRVFTVPTHPQRVLTASHTPTAGPGRHTATACLHRPHTPTACPHGLPHAHSGAGPAHSHCVSSPSPHTHSVSSRPPTRPQRGRAGTQPLRVFTVPTHPQRVLTASHTPTAGPGRHTATACLHRPHTPTACPHGLPHAHSGAGPAHSHCVSSPSPHTHSVSSRPPTRPQRGRAGTQPLRVFTVPTHPQRVLTASHTPTAGPGRHTATACLHRPHTPTACPHGLPHAHSGAGPAHSHCVSSPSPHTHSVSSRPPTRPQRGRAGTQPLRVFTVPTHPQRVLTASHTPTAGPGASSGAAGGGNRRGEGGEAVLSYPLKQPQPALVYSQHCAWAGLQGGRS
ncbi:PREDICTED: nascent polypeptide-associated complex subunit alpha, muscle-specific form-like [Ficedula albicollis]|uniref:nascent polypeptide-associated complex subunit alpha, muscle-specific form-like n=1 Tax=Ficedula albicollis TaxID=59894 RepID=UPI0007AD78A2|nr:PREDICTED: nascent polypeptide-associated complex subunit alpha, muscle-specific form-like [Ficedula albicollis]